MRSRVLRRSILLLSLCFASFCAAEPQAEDSPEANNGSETAGAPEVQQPNEGSTNGTPTAQPSEQGATDGTASTAKPAIEESPSDPCHYTSYAWDTVTKKATGRTAITKTKGELVDDERDPNDPRCTVCAEDQVEVEVPGLPKIKICKYYAEQVRGALATIAADPSFKIHKLEGYRPGKTRGPVVDGKRTLFSNHSYGTAIDINAGQNAIYNSCTGPRRDEDDLAGCKKGIGGPWRPKANPKESIARGGVVYTAFSFWKWGGDLPGQLKDFMHFSITGE